MWVDTTPQPLLDLLSQASETLRCRRFHVRIHLYPPGGSDLFGTLSGLFTCSQLRPVSSHRGREAFGPLLLGSLVPPLPGLYASAGQVVCRSQVPWPRSHGVFHGVFRGDLRGLGSEREMK